MSQSIGPRIRKLWKLAASKPGGKWLFSKLLGKMVPYTGSIHALVEILEPGYCRIRLIEHRRIRNHLRSVHAIALCNLGEMVTGLALMNSLPNATRGILTELSINYTKKARGKLTADCHCEVPKDNSEQSCLLVGEIRDQKGDLVSEVRAHWLIGPEKSHG
ncbi:MAG: hotdog fold domain-containing protein [Gammaproteobacteria bacterium]